MEPDGTQERPTRVLLVHANAEWYGSDRSFVALASGLRSHGCEVDAVLPARGRASQELVRAGVPVTVADPGVPRPRIWSLGRLLRWCAWDLPRSIVDFRSRAAGVDVVHLNTSTILGALVGSALARRPVVVHLHEYHPATSPAWRTYVRLTRPLVRRVLAISSDIADEARAAGYGDRVVLIPNGLPFGPVRPRPERHGVLSVGRINAWKGHEVLIDAVALARERGVDIRVGIAGDAFAGEEHRVPELERQIAERGVADLVTLLGFVDDLDELYREADVFVSATTRPEPFGLALIDAMAAGLAPIATDAGGPRDIIRRGDTGLLVPMGDVRALGDALILLHHDAELRTAMGERAARDVRDRFAIERTVAAVCDVYRDLRA